MPLFSLQAIAAVIHCRHYPQSLGGMRNNGLKARSVYSLLSPWVATLARDVLIVLWPSLVFLVAGLRVLFFCKAFFSPIVSGVGSVVSSCSILSLSAEDDHRKFLVHHPAVTYKHKGPDFLAGLKGYMGMIAEVSQTPFLYSGKPD